MNRKSIFLVLVSLSVALFVLVATWGNAQAQCGSSMSSCKNCHEVQGQDPVNDKGAWHQQHAFGDFCEFCHAGNVQAKDKDTAHQGMVDPMGDVKASCQGCHPDDYMDRAQKYATALGITISAGGGGASPSGGGKAAPSAGTKTKPAGGAAPAAKTTISVPKGGEMIDFNVLYEEAQRGEHKGPSVVTRIFIALDVILVFVFLAAAWRLEKWGERLAAWWQRNVLMPTQVAAAGATVGVGRVPFPSWSELSGRREAAPTVEAPPVPEALDEIFQKRPDLRALWPLLEQADRQTLDALARLLAYEETRDVLRRLASVDPQLVAQLRTLSAKERAILLALVQ